MLMTQAAAGAAARHGTKRPAEENVAGPAEKKCAHENEESKEKKNEEEDGDEMTNGDEPAAAAGRELRKQVLLAKLDVIRQDTLPPRPPHTRTEAQPENRAALDTEFENWRNNFWKNCVLIRGRWYARWAHLVGFLAAAANTALTNNKPKSSDENLSDNQWRACTALWDYLKGCEAAQVMPHGVTPEDFIERGQRKAFLLSADGVRLVVNERLKVRLGHPLLSEMLWTRVVHALRNPPAAPHA
jgi:hypothetical protein